MLPFKHQFSPTTITTPTGTVPLGTSTMGSLNPTTTFDISLSYVLFHTVRLDFGYQNVTPELVDNMGTRNSVFYSPGGATFYGNVSLYIDSLLDKALSPSDPKKTSQGRFGTASR